MAQSSPPKSGTRGPGTLTEEPGRAHGLRPAPECDTPDVGPEVGPPDVGSDAGPPDVGSDAGSADQAEPEPERAGERVRRWPLAAPPDGVPWTRMLVIGLVCFAVWFLLDAPSLQRSATLSPLGTRRTVSLDIVGPVASVSRDLGVSHVVGWADEVMGRTPGGGPALAKRTAPSLPPARGRVSRRRNATAPATAPTPALPALDQHPTAAHPLTVLVIGDSIGIDLGQPLVADLSATGVATATLDGRIDTGLSRPDYFDWPAELGVDLANGRPQLVVVMMGANDPQSLVGPGGNILYGAPGWSGSYEQRVSALIGEANAAGAHVLWVGMPPMASPGLNSGMQVLNSLVQSAVASHPTGAVYLSSVSVLGDPQGNFTAYLPDSSGAETNIRTPDGTHLSPDGGERLSQAVLATLRSRLQVDLPGG